MHLFSYYYNKLFNFPSLEICSHYKDFFLILTDGARRGSSVHVVEINSGIESAPNSVVHPKYPGTDIVAYHVENQPNFNGNGAP